MDIKSVIMEKYGLDCIQAAAHGYDIIKQHQQLLDDGAYDDYDIWGSEPDALTWAVKETYNALCDSAKRRWLSRVTREQMMGMLNAMLVAPWCTAIEWLHGESMGVPQLMDAWNKANPDQTPIKYAPEEYWSM